MEILIAISVPIIVVAIYFLWRNNKVYDFRIEINNKCYGVVRDFLSSIKNDKELYERYGEYKQLEMKMDEILSKHSYESMLYSLKLLKLKYWYTNEEIEFMNLEFVSKSK